MKRIFRSTFDPLPRALSTKGLVSLVLVVVLGTAVTVHRYVESSRHARGNVYGQGLSGQGATSQSQGNRVEARGIELRSAPSLPRANSLGRSRLGSNASGSIHNSTSGVSGCPSTTAPATAAQPTTPSAYQPQ